MKKTNGFGQTNSLSSPKDWCGGLSKVWLFSKNLPRKAYHKPSDGVNICLDPEFPNYQPEDIEILQYSGTMLEWAKGFPLCGNNETSPFCLEWRFNAADKTAKIDIT